MMNPGQKKMEILVSALNQVSYGCREVGVDFEILAETDRP
jgi:hypothetical protein